MSGAVDVLGENGEEGVWQPAVLAPPAEGAVDDESAPDYKLPFSGASSDRHA